MSEPVHAVFVSYERADTKRYAKVHDAFGALDDVTQFLRALQKYGAVDGLRLVDYEHDSQTLAEKIYERVTALIADRGIDPVED